MFFVLAVTAGGLEALKNTSHVASHYFKIGIKCLYV